MTLSDFWIAVPFWQKELKGIKASLPCTAKNNTVASYSNENFSFKWELPACLFPSTKKEGEQREWMGTKWAILIWIGRYCTQITRNLALFSSTTKKFKHISFPCRLDLLFECCYDLKGFKWHQIYFNTYLITTYLQPLYGKISNYH